MAEGPTRSRREISSRTRDRSRPPAPDPLPHPVVDNHCHLDIADGPDGDWLATEDALAAAATVGVTRIVQIGCDLPGARWAVQAAAEQPALVAGVALHPNEAPRLDREGRLEEGLAEIERLASSGDRVRAVGETGLDRFRTGPEGWAAQEASFRAHIRIAKARGVALIIHDRDAHEEILRVLEDEGAPEHTVFHCFSGDVAFAKACVERGFVLSFAGTMTFGNAAYLREAAALTPVDQLLVETDAPFLTPMPHRGRPNASRLVPHTVRALSEVTGVELTELCAGLTATAERVFGPWDTGSA
jgi:TatD DNase family protein